MRLTIMWLIATVLQGAAATFWIRRLLRGYRFQAYFVDDRWQWFCSAWEAIGHVAARDRYAVIESSMGDLVNDRLKFLQRDRDRLSAENRRLRAHFEHVEALPLVTQEIDSGGETVQVIPLDITDATDATPLGEPEEMTSPVWVGLG